MKEFPEIHVLNGDVLYEQFLELHTGAILLPFRECLVEGPVLPLAEETFWTLRFRYLNQQHQTTEQEYLERVKMPMDQIGNIAGKYFLWFEHDLFCQVNLWWIISRFSSWNHLPAIDLVYPLPETRWNGFGTVNSSAYDACMARRLPINKEGLYFGTQLWEAYKQGRWAQLKKLSNTTSPFFPRLSEVIQAQLDRLNPMPRPEAILRNLWHEGLRQFEPACREFHRRAGVYGFGDTQLKPYWQNILLENNSDEAPISIS